MKPAPTITPADRAACEFIRARYAAVRTRLSPETKADFDGRMANDLAAAARSGWWRRLQAVFAQYGPKARKSAHFPKTSADYGPSGDGNWDLSPPPNPPVIPPNIPEYAQRETDYSEVCAAQTGRFIPDTAYEKGRERRAEMDRRTVAIAQALECRGGRFYFGEDWADRCTVIGLFSGTVLPLPATRRVNFFPAHAAQQRAKMLRDIEFFVECHGQAHSRMYTITNGRRVPIHPVTLRDATQKFHRRLSKLAAHRTFKNFGIRMQWAATEYGTPEWDPETGRMTLHLHAHCLITEPNSMSRKRRARLRRKLWRVFGVHWDDAGPIENVREFVKYPAPPEDLDKIINEAGPGVLCDFYEAVKGLHISRPLGDLRRIRAQRKAQGRRLVRVTVENEGSILAEKADWNAGKRPLKDRKDRDAYKKRAAQNAQSRPTAAQTEAEFPDDSEALGETGRIRDGTGGGPRIKNRIIARLAPAPYGGPILEPAVVVWGFDGNLDAIRGQRQAAAIIEAHRPAWERSQAARALVHACARAARSGAASEGSQRSDNCPGAPPDWQRELAFAAGDDGPPGLN